MSEPPDFAAVDALDREPLPEARITGPLTRFADPEPTLCPSCGRRDCRGRCAPGREWGAARDPWRGW